MTQFPRESCQNFQVLALAFIVGRVPKKNIVT
jgi:hypothetical protein